MTEPTVACIMLTRDRPSMARRAVESFRRQTYENKALFIYDTSIDMPVVAEAETWTTPERIRYQAPGALARSKSIGELRNVANHMGTIYDSADVICHFDDDDWSHPNRIAEQVALLASSGADAVGYSDLLFWDTTRLRVVRVYGALGVADIAETPEAWLYSRPTRLNVPGTTLMYKRSTWERKPFPHLPQVGNPTSQGEDIVWQAGLKVEAVSSIPDGVECWMCNGHWEPGQWDGSPKCPTCWGTRRANKEPRMIASIHGANTMAFGYANVGHVEEFRRVECWDAYCARVMDIK